jgi:hypothetical protein
LVSPVIIMSAVDRDENRSCFAHATT